jgi:hypothetical protein
VKGGFKDIASEIALDTLKREVPELLVPLNKRVAEVDESVENLRIECGDTQAANIRRIREVQGKVEGCMNKMSMFDVNFESAVKMLDDARALMQEHKKQIGASVRHQLCVAPAAESHLVLMMPLYCPAADIAKQSRVTEERVKKLEEAKSKEVSEWQVCGTWGRKN